MKTFFWVLFFTVCVSNSYADLSVNVDHSKSTDTKAIVKLTMKNTYSTTVESARAAVFLMNDEGKVVGQKTEWVIGGSKTRPALAPDAPPRSSSRFPTTNRSRKPTSSSPASFSRAAR